MVYISSKNMGHKTNSFFPNGAPYMLFFFQIFRHLRFEIFAGWESFCFAKSCVMTSSNFLRASLTSLLLNFFELCFVKRQNSRNLYSVGDFLIKQIYPSYF